MADVTEQGLDHSADLEQEEVSQEDFQKLTEMMDEEGNLPPHGRADDDEVEAVDERDDPEPEPKGQPELEEVEYEGKKYTIPPEIKGALLRQADYTRKTQEVASERAAAQQERYQSQALMAEAAKFSGQISAIQQIDAQLQQLQQVDFARLQQEDPIKDLQLRAAFGELIRSREGAVGQLNAARQYAQQLEFQALQKQTHEGSQVLARDIPKWGPETQQALLNRAVSDYGFTSQELATLVDPRMVKVLHDAHQYRALQSQKSSVQKRVQQAPPKVVRASASSDRSEPLQAAKEIARLRRSGSDDDALAALRKLNIG